ncbi:MAG: rod shape-determining protein [Dysgonamonadaceae bacterium]|nr:rod shape-determining protein [Dysgonamonadaceae bacterium]
MENIVATLDIGSSKIVAMVAGKVGGQYNIIASETLRLEVEDQSKALVRRGVISDVSLAAEAISDVLQKLNKKLSGHQLRLQKIYIGYGGQGLSTKTLDLKREIEGTVVTEDLDSIHDEMYELTEQNKTKGTRSFFKSYFLDGIEDGEPLGKTCTTLECRYLLLTGHVCDGLKEKVEERTGGGITVEGMLVSAEATAFAVLEEHERKEGCVLVEIGAGVTTVSIYHGNGIKFLTTVPVGGLAVTKDICSLKIPFAEAENHKITTGRAQNAFKDSVVDDNLSEEEKKLKALNDVISARVKEIAVNVREQVIMSGHVKCVRSVVITGGGSSLSGLEGVFREITDLPVRTAIPRRFFVKQDLEESLDAANSAVIGMFAMVSENCCRRMDTPTENKGNGGWFKTTLTDLFTSSTATPNQSEVFTSKEQKERQRIEAIEKRNKEKAELERKEAERKEQERIRREEKSRKDKGPRGHKKKSILSRVYDSASRTLFDEPPIGDNKTDDGSGN